MHVLIDGYFLGKPYGFGRHIQGLCGSLSALPTGSAKISIAMPDRPGLNAVDRCESFDWIRLPDRNFAFWEQFALPSLAARLGCDVIHFPYNTSALFTRGIPRVCTVHDTLFLERRLNAENAKAAPGEGLKSKLAAEYTRLAFRLASKRSTVVTVSETSRRQLSRFGVDAKTVYNSVDNFVSAHRVSERRAGQTAFILHRGGYGWHRNTLRVIEAARRAREFVPDLRLVVIGTPEGQTQFEATDSFIDFKPWISDAEVADLYAQSACLVATSLFEGFCSPIIEAFGLQTPVITSDLDPMREIAGGAGLLVDPEDVDSIRDAIVKVVTDQTVATSLVELGKRRADDFSSATIGQRLLDVYEAAARR